MAWVAGPHSLGEHAPDSGTNLDVNGAAFTAWISGTPGLSAAIAQRVIGACIDARSSSVASLFIRLTTALCRSEGLSSTHSIDLHGVPEKITIGAPGKLAWSSR